MSPAGCLHEDDCTCPTTPRDCCPHTGRDGYWCSGCVTSLRVENERLRGALVAIERNDTWRDLRTGLLCYDGVQIARAALQGVPGTGEVLVRGVCDACGAEGEMNTTSDRVTAGLSVCKGPCAATCGTCNGLGTVATRWPSGYPHSTPCPECKPGAPCGCGVEERCPSKAAIEQWKRGRATGTPPGGGA